MSVTVTAVYHEPTKREGVTRHSIVLSSYRILTTVDNDLAKRAMKLSQDHLPVVVTSQPTPWGDELLSIERDTHGD